MSRRHCATSSCRAAARLMIGMSDVLGTASPAGTGVGRAAGKQIVHTGSRQPAWRKATHSLAAKAKPESLRLPGGLDGVEIAAARGIGLARRPGGPPGHCWSALQAGARAGGERRGKQLALLLTTEILPISVSASTIIPNHWANLAACLRSGARLGPGRDWRSIAWQRRP